ncbi:MAG: endo alpha-1,4 polygalactosaminidase [Spirochaetales bacterium]|nr:endo alpha-1,4 polygalactosaminidase [Spirochaetales bacterium]
MKKHIIPAFIVLMSFFMINCGTDDNGSTNTIYKQYMRSFVRDISVWAKTIHPGFTILPQNGHELGTISGNEDDDPAMDYISAIDGAGQEDLFYGYVDDDVITPESDTNYLLYFLNLYEDNGVEVLVTDYCGTHSYMDNSYSWNELNGFISFAADHRDLDNIPVYPAVPYNVNASNIITLADARNFLYLLDPTVNYDTKEEFVTALAGTNYDLFIIDLFFDEDPLTPADISALQTKANGGTRLVLCYMSIGEAEDYRYYWQLSWYINPPDWLLDENPEWEGNYKVKYWNPEWQALIFGNDTSYLKMILDAGFDGVYLDIIEAFEYFE